MNEPIEKNGKRLSSIRGSNLIILSLAALTSVTALFGIYQLRQKNDYMAILNSGYTAAFHQAAACISSADNILTKLLAARTPEQSAPLYASLWRQAASARGSLASLPYSVEITAASLERLSQVSDFSYSMMMKSVNGTAPEDSEYEQLLTIRELNKELSSEMASMSQQLSMGQTASWDKLAAENGDTASGANPSALLGSLVPIARQMREQPALVYDGQFSSHRKDAPPLLTEGKERISAEAGAELLGQILRAYQPLRVNLISESDDATGVIPVYSYEIYSDGEKNPLFYADMTKDGGYPLWILNASPYNGDGSALSIEEIIEKAADFLADCGFSAMSVSSNYEISDDSITVSFAPQTNGVIIYPDAVKVKLTADTGDVLGLEASGLVANSHAREFPEPLLSQSDALSLVNPYFALDEISLAVISSDSAAEALCYELLGSVGESKLLIYINCMTAKMEKILEVRENEYGVLTK